MVVPPKFTSLNIEDALLQRKNAKEIAGDDKNHPGPRAR